MPGEARRRRLRALLQLAKVADPDLDAMEAAFVHESAAKESGNPSNERMEFLGDSVLGMVVAHWLFAQFPDDREGVLAKRKAAIVSDNALAVTARRLGFPDLVSLGAGERASGGAHRISILADALEAFIAALYLRYGLETAEGFVRREHIAHTDHSSDAIGDAKTMLQELVQQRFACTPEYSEQGEGPPHMPRFTSVVSVKGDVLGTGTGLSKKAAQQEAAAAALRVLASGDPSTSSG